MCARAPRFHFSEMDTLQFSWKLPVTWQLLKRKSWCVPSKPNPCRMFMTALAKRRQVGGCANSTHSPRFACAAARRRVRVPPVLEPTAAASPCRWDAVPGGRSETISEIFKKIGQLPCGKTGKLSNYEIGAIPSWRICWLDGVLDCGLV